jgi:Nucleotidyl transferase AbiEii toxin, Type IV TA system
LIINRYDLTPKGPIVSSAATLHHLGSANPCAAQGGTALKRCYFADYRFSENLDFTIRQVLPFGEIRTRLEPIYAAVTP